MNRADWMTAVAGMAGILGIAFGCWWADSAAGALISLDIVRDGVKHVRAAAQDLVNRRPQRLTELDLDPIPEKLTEQLKALDWVGDAVVWVREDGNFSSGTRLWRRAPNATSRGGSRMRAASPATATGGCGS